MERPYKILVVTMWFIDLKSAVYQIRLIAHTITASTGFEDSLGSSVSN